MTRTYLPCTFVHDGLATADLKAGRHEPLYWPRLWRNILISARKGLNLHNMPMVMHIYIIRLVYHWFRWCLSAQLAPSHYLNQCWYIMNKTIEIMSRISSVKNNKQEGHCHHDLWDIDRSVQERRNSIANALELRLSCTNPSICCDFADMG